MYEPHVLIVDDDPIAVMIMEKLLFKSGVYPVPKCFQNGELALDYLKKHYSPNQKFIIFLDINMPVMNGWEFLDEVSIFARPDNTIVYMVTSSTDETDRNLAQDCSLVAKFLSKPVTLAMLHDLK